MCVSYIPYKSSFWEKGLWLIFLFVFPRAPSSGKKGFEVSKNQAQIELYEENIYLSIWASFFTTQNLLHFSPGEWEYLVGKE